MAAKSNGEVKMSLSQRVASMPDVATLSAWLDDPKNYTKERTVKGKDGKPDKILPPMRQPLSTSANLPDDIMLALVQKAMGSKGRLDDGDMTRATRNAVWLYLGKTQSEFDAWDEAEQQRIRAEKTVRMSGVSRDTQDKYKAAVAEKESLAEQLAKLMAKLQDAGIPVD